MILIGGKSFLTETLHTSSKVKMPCIWTRLGKKGRHRDASYIKMKICHERIFVDTMFPG